ncbi:MAG: rod shape-determining protein MreD [Gammaproteobacteria bacterium]
MSGRQRYWPILLFFLLALSLEVAPMPESLGPWRPPWVALAVIYWCMHQPGRFGVGIAWLIGLLLDVLKGAVLGQHALSLAVAAYVTIKLCQRLRVFPIWQQAMAISLIVAVHEFIGFWIDGMTGTLQGGLMRLAPIVSSVLVWPFMSLVIERLITPMMRR